MAEKDFPEHAVSISEQETVQGLTSNGPPVYSEVMTHDWTIQNDPQRSLAPPYEPPSVPMTNLSPGPVIHSSASGVSTGSTVVTTPLPMPAYQPQDPRTPVLRTSHSKMFVIIWIVIFFFAGTPLTLLCTLPALYCLWKVTSH